MSPPETTPQNTPQIDGDPELLFVIDVWYRLPESVRAGILALIRSIVG